MADTVYPLLRPTRRRHRRPVPRLGLRSVAIAVLIGMALMVAAQFKHAGTERNPHRAFVEAANALDRGDYSTARDQAMAAVTADPVSPAAHLMLARAYLAMGEGAAAEAELDRAVSNGVSPNRLHGPRARALFLQGDDAAALVEARAAATGNPLAIRTAARINAAQGDRSAAESLLAPLITDKRASVAGPALVDLAQLRLDGGDVRGADAAAAAAVRRSPRDPAALTIRGELVRVRYGLTAALPWFASALAQDGRYHPALIAYAATLGEMGRYRAMLAATRRALAAKAGSPQALYLQAVIAARADKMILARALLQRAGPIDQQIPGAMLLSGAIDYREGHVEQALATWRRLSERQPMNMTIRSLLAAALVRSGDPDAALDVLGPMLARDDADGYSLTLAARAAERLGDRIAAARYLDRAGMGGRGASTSFGIDATPAAITAQLGDTTDATATTIALIRAQIAAGDGESGIATARDAAAQAPGAPVVQTALGDALMVGGQPVPAIAAYTRAADLSFDQPTMLRLVDALGRGGHPAEAAATLALYLRQNPQTTVGQGLRAHWLVASGQGAQAVATLEALRRAIGNRNCALLTDLALAHVAAGEAAVARRYARAAYAVAPLNPAVVDAYGLALAANQDIAAARQMFAKAVSLDPTNPTIRAHQRQLAR